MTVKSSALWAYTYRLDPPQPVSRLKGVRVLLARERCDAAAVQGTWEGRLLADDRVSHILILSDSADLTSDANRRLEIALQSIDAGFHVTVPMMVPIEPADDVPPKD